MKSEKLRGALLLQDGTVLHGEGFGAALLELGRQNKEVVALSADLATVTSLEYLTSKAHW